MAHKPDSMTATQANTTDHTPAEPILSVDNLSVALSGKHVLSNINLQLHAGEIISIIGPNGGGKSTLIKAIAGLVTPSTGHIRKAKQLRVGYVPQDFTLPKSLPLRVIDFLKQSPDHQLTTLFALEPLLTTQVQSLSGGELQRVLLAHALHNQPDVVILDEPMQGLDPDTQSELYALIRQLPAQFGCAVLIVSHDLHWVMQGTDHVVCINQHICCEGIPADIQSESAFQSLYRTHQHAHIEHEHAGEAFYAHHHHCEHEHDCDEHAH